MEQFYEEEPNYFDKILEITQNRITELSRHLQTYLNNRKATIRAICSDYNETPNLSSINSIHKWEVELNLRIQEYSKYLKNTIGQNEDIKLKIILIAEKAKSSPSCLEAKLFNDFLRNKIRLWQILHILSGLEIHERPQLLKLVLNTLTRLYQDEEKINEVIPGFIKQIKLNYQQLDQEYARLCLGIDKEQIHLKKSKVIVRK